MSAKVAAEAPHSQAQTSHAARSSWSGKKKLVVAALVCVVVVVQAVAIWFALPGARSGKAGEDAAEKDHKSHAESADGEAAENEEIPLGEFGFSNSTASPGTIVHIDFKLVALTPTSSAAPLELLLKSHQARVRQAVNKVIRSASLEELNDPSLSTVKRLIREELNRLFKKTYILEIVITDVRTMDQ